MSCKVQASMFYYFDERQWHSMIYRGQFEEFWILFQGGYKNNKIIERLYGFVHK